MLDLLLGSHPQAASLGEITQFPKNLALNTPCTCGVAVAGCPVWTEVVSRLAERPQYATVRQNPYVLDLGFILASNVVDESRQTAAYVARRKLVYALAFASLRWGVPLLGAFVERIMRSAHAKLEFLQVVSEVMGREYLVDSSKHYLEAVALYRSAPERVRVILLTRDGRAVFYSGLKRGHTRKSSLNAWRHTYARGTPVLERHIKPEHLLRVSYESLTEDPAGELVRICDFLGVPYAEQMLQFGAQTHHVTNGNNMRFSADSRIRRDVAWRDRLSAEDVAYFETRAGAQNRALGYS